MIIPSKRFETFLELYGTQERASKHLKVDPTYLSRFVNNRQGATKTLIESIHRIGLDFDMCFDIIDKEEEGVIDVDTNTRRLA